jgi:hypothetical protein
MTLITVAEIEQKLRDDAEAIAQRCLPAGRFEGGYFLAGNVFGATGDSLVVYLKGNKRGLWWDYAGTDRGDMLDLIEQSQGLSGKGAAVALAKQWLCIEDAWSGGRYAAPDPAEMEARAHRLRAMKEERQRANSEARERQIRDARRLYLGRAVRPIEGTPAEAYLTGRGLAPSVVKAGRPPRWPGSLRYHPEVWNSDVKARVPALIAPLYLADGTHVATHRIYLQPCARRGWTKLDVAKPKKVLGAAWGAFGPINKGASSKPMSSMPADEPVYVTEGIEDAIVVRMARPEVRIVCAISLGNIGAIVLPARARRLIIVADRDDKPAAIDALERSIAQQQARGMAVQLVMPPMGIKDLNDWLLGIRKGAAA